jgi:hypothetical protein
VQHLFDDGYALLVVQVEERDRRLTIGHERELPCEIEGILGTGVEALYEFRNKAMKGGEWKMSTWPPVGLGGYLFVICWVHREEDLPVNMASICQYDY